MTPSADPAIALTSATDALIASIGQPREMTEADLPRLDALAEAIMEQARALTLLVGMLPKDFTNISISDTAVMECLAESAVESVPRITIDAYRYLLAAVRYQLAKEPA